MFKVVHYEAYRPGKRTVGSLRKCCVFFLFILSLHVLSVVFVGWMCSYWSVRRAQVASSLRWTINDPSASKLPERKRTWVYWAIIYPDPHPNLLLCERAEPSVADPGFPRRHSPTPKVGPQTSFFGHLFPKTAWNWKKMTTWNTISPRCWLVAMWWHHFATFDDIILNDLHILDFE